MDQSNDHKDEDTVVSPDTDTETSDSENNKNN